MRVVAGRFRGQSIASEPGDGVRPTSDRVRESVFNILAHGIAGFEIQDARVMDIFAGTGALGIEAISRGASYVVFVETAAGRRAVLRRNIEAFGLGGITRILKRDATDLGPAVARAQFTLAFLDPPYGKGLGEKALAQLADGGWLVDGAIVVAEEAKRTPMQFPAGFEVLDRRSYGETDVAFARFGMAPA